MIEVAPDPGFASDAYLHAKSVWKGIPVSRRRLRRDDSGEGAAFGKGRDPKPLSAVLSATADDMGWTSELDLARLLAEWKTFIGQPTADHTEVLGVNRGVLQVQCDSTPWATELRRLRGQILTRILENYPDAGVTDLRFLAPGAPSWRHGPRSVRGRGPRDTYG